MITKLIQISLAFTLFVYQSNAQIDHSLAQRYFSDVQQIARNDAGRFWGKSLEGPILLVDPTTRTVVANAPDREQQLTRRGNVYTGILPDYIPVANTAIEWAGVKWAMIIAPLPDDTLTRNVLIIHELWHRIQADIGFPWTNPSNAHLNTRDGRIWLRLELLALGRALTETGAERREALRDAVLFRSYRYDLFYEAASDEQQLEMHEGLAEYTGVRLATDLEEQKHTYVIRHLKELENVQSYVRSFAYATVPAYGLLLDSIRPGWHQKIDAKTKLGDLVKEYYSIQLPSNLEREAIQRAQKYGYESLVAYENEREIQRQKQVRSYLERYVHGNTLMIPLIEMKFSFDPRNVVQLDEHGTVYHNIEMTDIWGSLSAPLGALITHGWKHIILSAPSKFNGNKIEGEGYILEINKGWKIVESAEKGGYELIQN